ncbi:MAG: helix-turn-helix transcriptional regulator [Bacteroidaceae bacterium]|jgi:AraC-like DNA-binding protein|nr:helix-turn-helix transcriptional regulator [Bacteroidaceae bacterium]MBQ5655556.1 helix-turn-helix transcriptional regulator [Bacteroidaceae bacterium]MEE0984484.1 helix-turn-helix transcriptional regulator [Bacteroidaceae bacterium]
MRILNCITDFNHYFSAQTLHPQVAVAELFRADFSLFDTKVYDMYALIMIDGVFGELIRDGKPLPYTKGSLVTIRPGQSIEMKMDYTTKPQGWMLAFKPELLEKTGLGRDFYMFSYFNSDYSEAIRLTDMEYGVIKNCFANLYAELNTPKDHLSGQMIRLGIGTLLSYVKRYFEKQHTTSVLRSETLVGKLDTLLDKYLGSGLPAQHGQPTVTWCATQFNLSPNYFGDMIKKEVHITAQEYIRGKIVSHAQVLLRQTNMTINEIAEELGFAYPNHFTRMFHKATGYTPLKYRKGN